MTSQPGSRHGRHAFPVAKTPSFGSNSTISLPVLSELDVFKSMTSRKNTENDGVKRHGSFNVFDTSAKTLTDKTALFSNVQSKKSDRKLLRRTSSYAGSFGRGGWSRHSIYDTVDSDVTTDVTNDIDREAVSTESDDCFVTSSETSDVAYSADEYANESHDTAKENNASSDRNVSAKGLIRPDFECVQFESGFRSLPKTLKSSKRLIKQASIDDSDASDSTTKDSSKDRRDHLKKRMRKFEILPNFKKQLPDSSSHSSVDHSDDTLSDGFQSFEYEEVSTSFSVRHDIPKILVESEPREVIQPEIETSQLKLTHSLALSPSSSVSQDTRVSEVKTTNSTSDKNIDDHSETREIIRNNCETSSNDEVSVPKSKSTHRRSSEPVLKVTLGDRLEDPLAPFEKPEPVVSPRAKLLGKFSISGVYGRNGSRDADRPMSAGTSGYSTDEYKVGVNKSFVNCLWCIKS